MSEPGELGGSSQHGGSKSIDAESELGHGGVDVVQFARVDVPVTRLIARCPTIQYIAIQVCVEPRTSTPNMTLPAAASRAPAAYIDREPVRGASSYRSIFAVRARAEQQTSHTPLLLSIDGQTD